MKPRQKLQLIVTAIRTSSTGPEVNIALEKINPSQRKPTTKGNEGLFSTLLAKIFPWRTKEIDPDLSSTSMVVDSNIWIPNPTGLPNYNPTVPLGDLIKSTRKIPAYYKDNIIQFINEQKDINNTFNIYNKPQFCSDIFGMKHRETILDYVFNSDEDMAKWHKSSDSEWSEGYSKCELYRTDRNTAIFEGHLDTRVVKDGRLKRAGWCTMKTKDRLAFNRRRHYHHWRNFSHILIKCRGDGRSYKIMLHTPEYFDVTWGSNFSYPLHTHGGPYWQYEMIPFSRFFRTFGGRVQDNQQEIQQQRVSSIGIVLMDRIDGPFKFELGFIGVTHDTGHWEISAYETYKHPQFV